MPKFPAGTYRISQYGAPDLGEDSGYRLVVNAAQTLVTETFTRSGVQYESQYQITGTAGN